MGSQARARLGLFALVTVTLFSFGQVMAEGDYPGPALLGMAIAAGIALGTRRVGWGLLPTIGASLGGLVWYLTAVFQMKHSFYSLPTPTALQGLVRQMSRAYEHSLVDYSPVPVRPGYVILIVIAMWLLATIGELAAFRWKRPIVAAAGPIALFSFILVVGTRVGAPLLVAIFLTALLTFWGLEAAHRLRSWGRWVPVWGHQSSEEPAAVTGSIARRMGVSCVAIALVAPLFLPALNDGLLSWRSGSGSGSGSGGGGGSGASVDPLVSIVPQLIRQNDAELFRVTADRAAYWRLVSLSDFDGESWRPPNNHEQATLEATAIQTSDRPLARYSELTATFDIMALEGQMLPAAVHPVTIDFSGEDRTVTYDTVTADLRAEEGLSNALNYTVVSYVPDLTLPLLKEAVLGTPGPEYLEIPGELPDEVLELLDRWTAEQETAVDKLIAIQDQLRSFDYSLNVEDSASKDYLSAFLTETQTGYCQQFATAFAVLARQLGYPARVSVGFLPGETDPADPDRFLVRGTDTHAWPEVYFEGFGWVPFEPTPRSAASPPVYTVPENLPANPDQSFNGQPAGEGEPGADAAPLRDPRLDPRSGGGGLETGGTPNNDVWRRSFSTLLRLGLVMLAIYLLVVPFLKMARISRMYSRAQSPGDTAFAAFAHVQAEAAELASARRPAESAGLFLARLAAGKRMLQTDAVELAALYDRALYGPGAISADEAGRARRLAQLARRSLWTTATIWQRGARLFSIASLRETGTVRRRPALRVRHARV